MLDFPTFNSKELSDGKTYNLNNPSERLNYFHAKLGPKIDEVKEYLEANSFVGFMLAKKMAGKGTYAKMIEEILGPERFAHISVGDVIRSSHAALETQEGEQELREYLQEHYRGFLTIDEVFDSLRSRSQDKVDIPTEFILTMLKREIGKIGRKALFIDGLPRNMDQISYSLYFRDLIDFRDDPDFFILIDVPLELIRSRMENRLICPLCKTSKNLAFNPTKYIKYDKSTESFYLVCDNQSCEGYGKERYVEKEGDSEGLDVIKGRLENDQKLMERALSLQGIPKVLIRSSMPVEVAGDYLEDYEVQPEFSYSVSGEVSNSTSEEVEVHKKPWTFQDDEGVDSHTMLAAVYVVDMFSQIHKILLG